MYHRIMFLTKNAQITTTLTVTVPTYCASGPRGKKSMKGPQEKMSQVVANNQQERCKTWLFPEVEVMYWSFLVLSLWWMFQCIGVSGWSSEKALWQSKYLVECDFDRTAAFAVNFHQYIFFYRIASSDDIALRCPLLKSFFLNNRPWC